LSIIYHHSLALSDLAISLQSALHEEQKKSPLRSPLVVIPNVNIERWLKINLPKLSLSKISLNIRYVFLEKILEELTLTRDKNYNTGELIYSHSEIEKKIFQYLTQNKKEPAFSFLGKYLDSPNRTFYLSTKLANYFKDYELNRAYWIYSWAKDLNLTLPILSKASIPSDNKTSDYYRLEKKIYTDLFLNEKNTKTTLSQYLISSSKEAIDLDSTSLHLFCLANLADTYLHVLNHLSSHANVDVHFYQFHTGETDLKIKLKSESPIRWSYPQTHLAHSLASLTKIAEVTRLEIVKFPDGLVALRELLKGNMHLAPIGLLSGFGSTEDASLRIWNAPSVYREVESVANDIMYKMNLAKQEGHDLSLLDFSILLTDINAYRSAIEWVFDGGILVETTREKEKRLERQKLPYSLVDLKASDASPLYRALSDFWDLCNPKGFKFPEFQSLFRSTLLSEDGSDLEDLESLLSTLGVAYEDTLSETDDPFQISNGIRRAVLSSIISDSTAEEKFDFASINVTSENAIIQLTEIWLRVINAKNAIKTFLSNGKWDKTNLEILRNALESLFQLDTGELENRSQFYLFWNQVSPWEGIELNEIDGLEILKLLTNQAFDGISVKKGDYLTGGVTISLLQPMRPLPFKHVYILGLGEGKFPGTIDGSKLNLRHEFPEEWDLNKKQIQESLLWESFFSANESLTLSYVGKNTKEDKIFEPCSCLYEIMQGLGILQATEIPLVSYSKAYDHSENALKAGLVSYDYARSWVRDPYCNPDILNEFQDLNLLSAQSKQSIGKTKINLSELNQYVKDPLDTFLKKKLGMYITEETEGKKEEIFYLDSIRRSVIQKEVYLTIFANLTTTEDKWDRKKIESILDPIIQKEIKHARFPNAVFTKLEKENILDHFVERENLFAEWSVLLKDATYHRYVSFGNTGLSSEQCLKFPALQFSSLPNVLLYNECEHIFEKNGTFYIIYTKRIDSDIELNTDFANYKDYFGNITLPFLNWASFAMNGLALEILTTNLKTKEGLLKSSLHFQVKDAKKEATIYLETLAQAFMSELPQFFPRILYLNFFYEHFGKAKTELFTSNALHEMENDWGEFQKEEADTLYSNLTPISKLYPKTNEFLFQPNIDFANKFYAPISLWRTV
jgi:exodeoxyribonuclease V gamma subunit